jgi:hypothetical protein
MKKLALTLLLLPVLSFADNVNFFGTQYTWMSGIPDEEPTTHGYTISYESVIDETISAGFSYVNLNATDETTKVMSEMQEVNVSADFAFAGSFDTGALYVGLQADLHDNSDRSFLTKIGVASRSGKGFDFDANISSSYGDIGIGGSIRGQLPESAMGWEIGFMHIDDSTTNFAGISLAF